MIVVRGSLSERQRLPEAISGHEALIDADCPCCQMLADLPGPINSPDVPLGIRRFGIGGHLAELITDLREPPKRGERTQRRESRDAVSAGCGSFDPAHRPTADFIEQLNRDFGNLREVLTGAEAALTESLVEPVLARFTETLEAVAAQRPDLDPKCEALFAMLRNFLEPTDPELPDLFPDDGVPF